MFAEAFVLSLAMVSTEDVALEQWLAGHALGDVAMEMLEQRLDTAAPSSRRALRARLAMAAARHLATLDDPAQRRALLYRSEELLDELRGEEALPLQLEILAIGASGLERVLDLHRLGMLDEAALEGEVHAARKLRQRLLRLHQELQDSLNRLEEEPTGPGREALRIRRESLNTATARVRRAAYLLGWATLHAHELGVGTLRPRDAQRRFEAVIELPEGSADPADAPSSLRSALPVGWSMIGQAMALARQGRPDEALTWLDALDDPAVPEAVAVAVLRWRLQVLLDAGRLDQAAQLAGSTPLDSVNAERLRLAARIGYAQEHAALVDVAVAELARRGEIAHLHALAVEWPLTGEGFAQRVAAALAAWDHAGRVDTSQAWREAGRRARSALAQAEQGDAALVRSMHRLAAWAAWQDEDWADAATHFQAVESGERDEVAQEALVMAIAARQRLDVPDDQVLDSLLAASLERFPEGRWAGRHAVAQVQRQGGIGQGALELLMRIDADDAAWPAARMMIEQTLYRRWALQEDQLERGVACDAYLTWVLPRLSEGVDPNWARRSLSVALDSGVPRLEAAQVALSLLPEDHADIDQLARRAQVAVLSGALDQALEWANLVHQADAASDWSRFADRLVFDGLVSWPRAQVAQINVLGQRMLEPWPDDTAAAADPLGAHVLRGLASAAWSAHRRTGARQDAVEAAMALDRLDRVGMLNASLTPRRAELAEALGQHSKAMRMWTTVLGAFDVGSESWFRAQLGRLSAQATIDPAAALEALEQLEVLYPGFGVPPWNIDLRLLHARLSEGGVTP